MTNCEICTCLQAQLLAAIEQGDAKKLAIIQGWVVRHNAEHDRVLLEAGYKRAMEERAEETMAKPGGVW